MVSLCSNQGTADKIASYQDIGDQRCVTLVTNQKQLWSLFFFAKKLLFEAKNVIITSRRSGEEANAAVCKTAIRGCKSRLRLLV